jgi:hypothetical protein
MPIEVEKRITIIGLVKILEDEMEALERETAVE